MPAEVVTKSCRNCGREVSAKIDPELSGTWRVYAMSFAVLCEKCNAEYEQKLAADAEAEKQRTERDRYQRRLERSGLPALLQAVKLDDLDIDANSDSIRSARAWAAGEITSLVLSGDVGVGKTYLAAAATNEMLQRRAARWVTAPRFMIMARSDFRAEARQEITELLLQPKLALVLDDLDKANATAYALDLLFEAIDARLNAGTPLLVTTNLRWPALKERFGEALASRLATATGHRMEGSDRRRA